MDLCKEGFTTKRVKGERDWNEKALNRVGFYCEDCDKIMDSSAYRIHNSDHTMKAIVWDFLGEPSVKETKQ